MRPFPSDKGKLFLAIVIMLGHFLWLLTVTFTPFDYFTVAARRLGWCHHVHAHVWAHVIIEVHAEKF